MLLLIIMLLEFARSMKLGWMRLVGGISME
jgi:hypothetical protein